MALCEELRLAFGEPGRRGDQGKRDKQTKVQKKDSAKGGFRHGGRALIRFHTAAFLKRFELGNLPEI